MSMFSTLDIAKNEAIQNSLDNLSRCVRFYADPGPSHSMKMSIHYLRQRARIAKRYGRDSDRMWL